MSVSAPGFDDRHDPIGLATWGAPHNEYEPEVGTIIPRLRSAASAEEVTHIIYEEFSRWFGAESYYGPQKGLRHTLNWSKVEYRYLETRVKWSKNAENEH